MEWQPIEAQTDEESQRFHVRGLWVNRSSRTLPILFEYHVGRIDDEGDFVNEYGDCEAGWEPEDFTHWMPLPAPPQPMPECEEA